MAYFRCGNGNSGGGGGQLSETLLWENAQLSRTYSYGTATLTESFKNYKYIKFTFNYDTSTTSADYGAYEAVYNTDTFEKFYNSWSNYGQTGSIGIHTKQGEYYARLLYTKDSTYQSVYIDRAYRYTSSSGGYYDGILIPYRIYGLK